MALQIPMRFEDERLLWVVDDVYSREECARFVDEIEAASPGLATNNPRYRDQDRVIRDDPGTAGELFARIRSALPLQMGALRLHGLNERLRMYRYQPGQRFAPHMDHWFQPDTTHVTLHTVLVYFNDDFEGGVTRFHEQLEETVAPRTGRCAIFQHKLRHEGCPVLRGTKYAMRTDAVYEASEAIGRLGFDAH